MDDEDRRALDLILDHPTLSDHVGLATTCGVIAGALLWFVLAGVIGPLPAAALGVLLAVGTIVGGFSVDQAERTAQEASMRRIADAKADVRVLDAISSGRIRNLDARSARRIRAFVGDRAWLHAANGPGAALRRPFA